MYIYAIRQIKSSIFNETFLLHFNFQLVPEPQDVALVGFHCHQCRCQWLELAEMDHLVEDPEINMLIFSPLGVDHTGIFYVDINLANILAF